MMLGAKASEVVSCSLGASPRGEAPFFICGGGFMKFRFKRSRDRELLERLHKESFPGDEEPDWKGVWWVVFAEDGEAAGFCGVNVFRKENMLFITRTGVSPDYRGWGLQKRMFRVIERFARKHGFDTLISYTITENPVSSNNFIQAGYRLYAPDWAWVGNEVLYWIKVVVPQAHGGRVKNG